MKAPSIKAARNQSVAGVELVRLGRTDWRVTDAAHPDRLLGYIERQRSGRFEVMWMTDPIRWGYAASFDDALAAFGDSVLFAGEISERRAHVEGRTRATGSARRTTWIKSSGHESVA
jgi:hypothetical protein